MHFRSFWARRRSTKAKSKNSEQQTERTSMNNKFDELAKGLAQSTTRRQALKKFGVGLAGMALACFGMANKAEAGEDPNCFGYGVSCCSQRNKCCKDAVTRSEFGTLIFANLTLMWRNTAPRRQQRALGPHFLSGALALCSSA
jgi:hypothetical protein